VLLEQQVSELVLGRVWMVLLCLMRLLELF
jgi:hypothetical protein